MTPAALEHHIQVSIFSIMSYTINQCNVLTELPGHGWPDGSVADITFMGVYFSRSPVLTAIDPLQVL